MKKSILLFFVLLMANGYSQDVDPVNIVDYTLILQDEVSSVTISTNKLTPADRKLILRTITPSCNFQKGIVIKFVDNETIKLRDQALTCSKLDNGKFELSGTISVDEALYNKLSTADLVGFQLGSIRIPAKFQGEENLQNLISFISQNK